MKGVAEVIIPKGQRFVTKRPFVYILFHFFKSNRFLLYLVKYDFLMLFFETTTIAEEQRRDEKTNMFQEGTSVSY